VRHTVTIDRGFYLIDGPAWIGQRVGPRHDEFTTAVREFAAHPLFSQYHPAMDPAARVQLWCAARGWIVTEDSPLYHDDPCLSATVTVVLATAPGPTPQPVAITWTHGHRPVVYPDVTTDSDYWHAVTAVDIVCPHQHRWSWIGGADLLDDRGQYRAVAEVFGQRSPLTDCRDCAAYDAGTTEAMCWCGQVSAIYCPTCQQRCQLALPGMGT
jgi:hypothetical protein